jgi:hypothetical protein
MRSRQTSRGGRGGGISLEPAAYRDRTQWNSGDWQADLDRIRRDLRRMERRSSRRSESPFQLGTNKDLIPRPPMYRRLPTAAPLALGILKNYILFLISHPLLFSGSQRTQLLGTASFIRRHYPEPPHQSRLQGSLSRFHWKDCKFYLSSIFTA